MNDARARLTFQFDQLHGHMHDPIAAAVIEHIAEHGTESAAERFGAPWVETVCRSLATMARLEQFITSSGDGR